MLSGVGRAQGGGMLYLHVVGGGVGPVGGAAEDHVAPRVHLQVPPHQDRVASAGRDGRHAPSIRAARRDLRRTAVVKPATTQTTYCTT